MTHTPSPLRVDRFSTNPLITPAESPTFWTNSKPGSITQKQQKTPPSRSSNGIN